jgi:hypothetical protein
MGRPLEWPRARRYGFAPVPGSLSESPLPSGGSGVEFREGDVGRAFVREHQPLGIEEPYVLSPSTPRFFVSLGGSQRLFWRSNPARARPGSRWGPRPSPSVLAPVTRSGAPGWPRRSRWAASTGPCVPGRSRRSMACALVKASEPNLRFASFASGTSLWWASRRRRS